jgi:hypothetical protein
VDRLSAVAHVTDPGREQLGALFTDELTFEASQGAADDLIAEIAAALEVPPADQGGKVPPDVVLSYLETARGLVEARLEAWAQVWSGLRWLWYLRRVPDDVVHGNKPGSLLQLSNMATTISGRSKKAEPGLDALQHIPVPINNDVARALARFCAGIRLLHQVQSLIRRLKRGAEFAFPHGPIPQTIEEQALTDAIEFYDARLRLAQNAFFNRLGTLHLKGAMMPEGQPPPLALVVSAPALTPSWAAQAHGPDEFWASFASDLVPLQPLTELLLRLAHGAKWWPDAAGPLVALLTLIPRLMDDRPTLVDQLLAFGYVVLASDDFLAAAAGILAGLRAELEATFPDTPLPVTSEEIIELVEPVDLSTWPMTGGRIAFRTDTSIVVDIAAATRHLDCLLELPAGGQFDAARSVEFELAAQQLIDGSSWANAALASHRGATLHKADGGQLTDIDAIGGKGDRVLLVDCKSYVYKSDYEVGPPNAVKNAATTVDGKATHMKDQVVTELMASMPAIFAGFTSVIGIVCTSTPLYVPLGDATEDAEPGLPRALSLLELRRWLDAN